MRALRVIFLTSLLLFLAGGAFAENNPGARSQGGKGYAAPDFDFSGPMKTELLLVVVGAALLLARRRRGRAMSKTHLVADEPPYSAKVREVAGATGPENDHSFNRSTRSFVDFE